MRIALLTCVLMLCFGLAVYADPAPVQVSVVSVRAVNEGHPQKVFGAGLETVKRAVGGLDYDTFSKVSSADATIPFGEKTTFFVNSKYSVLIEPTSVDGSGRVRLHTQVLMKSKDKNKDKVKVKALDTFLVMAPGKQMNLGGLKLTDGDLIIVLSVK